MPSASVPLARPARRHRWFAAVLLGAASRAALAIEPDTPIDWLTRNTWGRPERAPAHIGAIALTTDGFVWLSAMGGMVRFDGVTFDPVAATRDGPLPRERVEEIAADLDGHLWIAYAGGAVWKLRDGGGQAVASLPPEAGRARRIVLDATGAPWILALNGVYRLEKDGWRKPGADARLEGRAFDDLQFDADGAVWVLSDAGLFLQRPQSATFERVLQRQEPSLMTGLTRAVGSGVWLWTATGDDNLCRVRPDRPMRCWRSAGITRAALDAKGSLWWPGTGGTMRLPHPESLPDEIDAVERQAERMDGLLELITHARDGSVWGSMKPGLVQLRESQVRKARTPTGALVPGENGEVYLASFSRGLMRLGKPRPDDSIFLGRDNTLWTAAAKEQGATIKDTLTFEPFDKYRAPDEPVVLQRYPEAGTLAVRLDRDRVGSVFVGVLSPPGLVRLREGRVERLPPLVLGRGAVIRGVATDAQGKVWFAANRTPAGLYRQDGEGWAPFGGAPGAKGLPANGLLIDGQERTWIAIGNDAVGVIERGRLRKFSADDGLAIGQTGTLHAQGDQVWVAGDRGLALHRNGRFFTMTGVDDQRFVGCSGIRQTVAGDLWLNCAGGLFRILRSEWTRFAEDPSHRVTSMRFDHLDGVVSEPIVGGPVPSLAEGSDGRIWFNSRELLYWVDPGKLPPPRPAPPVIVRRVVADDQSYSPDQAVSLPPGTQRINFFFLAPGAEVPQRTRFRVRLRDVDADWVDAGLSREIGYSRIRPGEHLLEVIASDSEGRWGTTPTAFSFQLRPAFHQTTWFIGLCVLTAGLLAWGVYHLRVRQITTRLRLRAEAQAQERERIARDLHDTLIQSTHGLLLSVQSLADRTPNDHPDKARIERALERADQAVHEGRWKVLELRAGDDQSDLVDLLEDLVSELNERGPARIAMRVEGSARPLASEARGEALHIGQEALRNAQRHAQARRIEVVLRFEEDALTLRISDDGEGMSPTLMSGDQVRPGHFGLKGLRERAARLEATLDIRAGETSGTVVEVRIPARRAFA